MIKMLPKKPMCVEAFSDYAPLARFAVTAIGFFALCVSVTTSALPVAFLCDCSLFFLSLAATRGLTATAVCCSRCAW